MANTKLVICDFINHEECHGSGGPFCPCCSHDELFPEDDVEDVSFTQPDGGDFALVPGSILFIRA